MPKGLGYSRETGLGIRGRGLGLQGAGITGEGEKKIGRTIMSAPASTNSEVISGELGWWTVRARWDIARLMFWYKLWWGKNALASWVFQQAKESWL